MKLFAAGFLSLLMAPLVGCDGAPRPGIEAGIEGMTGGDAQADGAGPDASGQADVGASASVPAGPSCANLPPSCGRDSNESCCGSSLVSGGMFFRSFDGSEAYAHSDDPATVSTFRLDRFEVTVGRFRRFVAAWNAKWRPDWGSGKHAHLNGGAGLVNARVQGREFEDGWRTEWSAAGDLTGGNFLCNAGYATWTPSPGANENRPITCVDWVEAYAFCIWDGGFLPSEAEWNYAAAGGSEQRAYPWVAPGSVATIDCAHANYRASSYCSPAGGTNQVGSESPQGDGRFGQADLAGNVWEWTLDEFESSYISPCIDCAYLPDFASRGAIRGGGFDSVAADVLVSRRNSDLAPSDRGTGSVGFRCARTPAPL